MNSVAMQGRLPPAMPSESAESRSMQLKQKMNQQRQLLLQRQRGNAQHFLHHMAQANTHAPLAQAPVYRSMGDMPSSWSLARQQSDLKKADQQPESLDTTAPTSEVGGEVNDTLSTDCDNVSEATCDLMLDNAQQARVGTPTSVIQPRSFLQGDDPRAPSRENQSTAPMDETKEEKAGGKWWKPSFNKKSRAPSAPPAQRQDETEDLQQVVDVVQEFGGDRPFSGDRPQMLVTPICNFGP
eukprot:TRINITY_DN41969_c0_g1_i1.p1 TRINITY_DN41969_c0_g1~~TRINITY_DN41969_c0_g1_i1.p1  ORF type:complete len:240 (-),score=46.42 TRINITY_DN41969_c0_g1_i1:621-1340(-)